MDRQLEVLRVEVAKLTIEPGDILVLMTKDTLPEWDKEELWQLAKGLVPDNMVAIVDAGFTIGVIKKKDLADIPIEVLGEVK